ncbi:MAG TPA: response regulator transcription factor [Anaerolineales bacterium]|nr:response regulator transcription factor [Anaerolineales bacterium]
MKLLIVDDHVLFREGLAAIIRPERDFEIAGLAGTVKEAVEMAETAKPDMILMDFTLPDGTGADATRLILNAHPECKIVFLTMSEEDEDLLEAIRSGAKGYLLKNMQPQKLIVSLRSVQKGESALSRSMTMRLMEELSRTKKPETPPSSTLTHREIEVLRAVAAGLSNQEIARQLFISENTVKYHVHSILGKLGLTDRKEVAAYAREHGLIKD